MHFCRVCNNMYYIKLADDDESTLIYYCRKCGDENKMINEDSICVSKTYLKRQTVEDTSIIVNKYTKFDPTLPRLTNIRCPNVDCVTNTEDNTVEPDVVSVRYDNLNVKYLYICSHCDFTWKNSNF